MTKSSFEEFCLAFEEGIYLDENRMSLVKSTFNCLNNLVSGKLVKQNRFKRLLLGRKAVGKTSMLKNLQNACKTCFPDVICIFINYSDPKSPTPLEILKKKNRSCHARII